MSHLVLSPLQKVEEKKGRPLLLLLFLTTQKYRGTTFYNAIADLAHGQFCLHMHEIIMQIPSRL